MFIRQFVGDVAKFFNLIDRSLLNELYDELYSIAETGKEPSDTLKAAVTSRKFSNYDVEDREHCYDDSYDDFDKTIIGRATSNGHMNIFKFIIENNLYRGSGDRVYQDILLQAVYHGRLCIVDYVMTNKFSSIDLYTKDSLLVEADYKDHRHVLFYLLNKGVTLPPDVIQDGCVNSYINITGKVPQKIIGRGSKPSQKVTSMWTYNYIPISPTDKLSIKLAAKHHLLCRMLVCDERTEECRSTLCVDDCEEDRLDRTANSLAVLKNLKIEHGQAIYYGNIKSIPLIKFLFEVKCKDSHVRELLLYSPEPNLRISEIYYNCHVAKRKELFSDDFARTIRNNYPGENYAKTIEDIENNFLSQMFSESRRFLSNLLSGRRGAIKLSVFCKLDCIVYWSHAVLYNASRPYNTLEKEVPFNLSIFLQAEPINEYASIYAFSRIRNERIKNTDETEIAKFFVKYYQYYIQATATITNEMSHWIYSRIRLDYFCSADRMALYEEHFLNVQIFIFIVKNNSFTMPAALANIIIEYADELGLCSLYGIGNNHKECLFPDLEDSSEIASAVITDAVLEEKQHVAVPVNTVPDTRSGHSYTGSAVKWFMWAVVGAIILYGTGGLAVIPYASQLGAWAILAISPFLAMAEAAVWNYIIKPGINYFCAPRRLPAVANARHGNIAVSLQAHRPSAPGSEIVAESKHTPECAVSQGDNSLGLLSKRGLFADSSTRESKESVPPRPLKSFVPMVVVGSRGMG